MMWLTWRQLRSEYIALTAMMALLAGTIAATGIAMRGFEGGIACLSAQAAPTCGGQGDFVRAFGTLFELSGWLNVVPLIIGVFVGAPLVAREVERGTHMLAWTQSVTRARWISFKLVSVVALAAVVGGVFALVMTWWRQPWDLIGSSFTAAGFDLEGVMPVDYSVFAVSLGVLTGTIIGRTLPAMAVTLVGFLAVRLPIEFLLRPHFMTPVTAIGVTNAAPAGAWLLDQGLVDSHGHQVFLSQAMQLCNLALTSDPKQAGVCLARYGIHASVVYQPADRFWPFQLIEGGAYAALSLVCLAVAIAWIRSPTP
jgi:hypothetical protein